MEPSTRRASDALSDTADRDHAVAPPALPAASSEGTHTQTSHVELLPNASTTSLSNLLTYGSDSGSDVDNIEIEDMYEESEDSASSCSELPCDIPPISQDAKEQSVAEDDDEEDDDEEEEEEEDDADEVNNDAPAEEETTCKKGKKNAMDETLRKMGELHIDDLPPVCQSNAEVKSDECDLIGTVSNTLGKLVMVESIPNKPAYDIDTLLFLDSGKRPLGYIFDVIGPVHNPLYAIRFNSVEEIAALNLDIGMNVYSAPATEHTRYVFVQQLLKERGSDASWKNDVEVPKDMQDSSEDEAIAGLPANRKRRSLERHQQFEEDMNLRNTIDTQMHRVHEPRRSRYRQSHHHQPPSTRGRKPPPGATAVLRGGGRRPAAAGAMGGARGFPHPPAHTFYAPPPGAAASPCAYSQTTYSVGAPCYGVSAPAPPLPPYMPMYMRPLFSTPPPPPGTLLFPPDMGLPPVQRTAPYVPSMQYYNAPIVWTNYRGQQQPPQPQQQRFALPPPPQSAADEQRDAKSGDNFFKL